ncbi:MAG: tripartite tricarboxylate transporter TctB family protein [Paucibacter sp.]|nr:tripartite tricarboxylate transporter TctB family protein [Roseateles sp.]
MGIALLFGVTSMRYRMGALAHPGPGLFPIVVSSALLAIGIAVLARSRYLPRVPVAFKARNIGLLIASLMGFALISALLNMAVAIAFLVFVSGLAAPTYSVARSLKITVCLLLIALVLQNALGLNLHLY